MLDRVRLTNFALFKDETIEFDNGFNSLMGETGAGKSIIIDALSFIVGAKSDKIVIRHGEKAAKVEAMFSDVSDKAKAVFAAYGIEGDEVVISRTLHDTGKNDIRINGNFVTLSILKEVGAELINIFGQHENLLLLNDKNHMGILDAFDNQRTSQEKCKLQELLSEYDCIQEKIDNLGGDEAERLREIDLLSYAINEIEAANAVVGEDEELAKNILRYSGSEKIVTAINSAVSMLDLGSVGSVCSNLKQSSRMLSDIEKFDQKFSDLSKRLEQAGIEINDVIETLQEEANALFFDERQLENMIEREQQLKKLKRKYGATLEDVLIYLNDAKRKKDDYENAEYEIAKLEQEKIKVLSELKAVCDNLTKIRKDSASSVEKLIEQELVELGMKNTTFKVQITYRSEHFARNSVTTNGQDVIKFLFSANLGQELKSLSKTISGGEMSRFMLAVKSVLKNDEGLMVFDEVDAGVGGQIAVNIAEKLARISKTNQILCISHLPQVCSMGDSFYKVEKKVEAGQTVSKVKRLQQQEIPQELASMGFGEPPTGSALDYAKDLIEKNKLFKMGLNA